MHLDRARVARLLGPYVALWFVVAAALGGYAWYEIASTRERELAEGRIEADNLARVLQEQVARNLEGLQRTLDLVRIVHERTPDGLSLAGLTDALVVASSSEVERRVTRFDRNGNLIDSTDRPRPLPARTVADLPWFQQARERPGSRLLIGEPTIGRVSGVPIIPIAMRLSTPTGEFDGVLVTALDPERMVHLFRTIRVGERSTVGLMDREGRLYVWSASTDPMPSGVSVAGIPRSATTFAGDNRRTMSELVNDDSVVALAAIPATDLVAFAALPTERLLADQRRFAHSIVGFALLTLVGLTLPIVVVARRAYREVAQRSRLEAGMEAERRSARTDPLTEAANRRAFEHILAQCHRELCDNGTPFVLAMVDVDRFKQLNDTYGHAEGDRALQRIARTLMGGVRRSDLVARLGGDEFAVLMPHTDSSTMHRPFDAMFTALTVAVAGEGWPISFSFGVIAFEAPVGRPEDASQLADKLMYAVKQSGRNGVRFAVFREQRLHPEPATGIAGEDAGVI
ncbi:MAG: sensor domain-containing diguanylate cyclase [Betaproteobacteria bacterium]